MDAICASSHQGLLTKAMGEYVCMHCDSMNYAKASKTCTLSLSVLVELAVLPDSLLDPHHCFRVLCGGVNQVLMQQSSDTINTAIALVQHAAFHIPLGVDHYVMYMSHSIEQMLSQPGIQVSFKDPTE